jgi:hypothetical protein
LFFIHFKNISESERTALNTMIRTWKAIAIKDLSFNISKKSDMKIKTNKYWDMLIFSDLFSDKSFP